MLRTFLLVLLAACGTAATDRTTLDSIPKAAADALRTQANGAEITAIERETAKGTDYYEASWHENGLAREAKVRADGTLVESERELRPDEVPVPVREAAAKTLPAGAVITFALLHDGRYEAETIVDRKEHDAIFTADGTRVPEDQDDESNETDD